MPQMTPWVCTHPCRPTLCYQEGDVDATKQWVIDDKGDTSDLSAPEMSDESTANPPASARIGFANTSQYAVVA